MSTALATLPDMSTARGQARHYEAVHARLWNLPPARRAVPRNLIPAPAPVKPKPVRRALCPLNMLAPPSWLFLRKYVAVRHAVSVKDIMGHRKPHQVIAARHELAYLMHTHMDMSYPAIGRRMGRDHSTVINSVRKHEQKLGLRSADAVR